MARLEAEKLRTREDHRWGVVERYTRGGYDAAQLEGGPLTLDVQLACGESKIGEPG